MTPTRARASGADPDPHIGGRRLEDLLGEFRPHLQRMVTLRLDPRLRSRVDTSDVIQDAYLEVSRRIDDYNVAPDMPFFLWVRQITRQKLIDLFRMHMGAARRDVRREKRAARSGPSSSVSLAHALRSSGSSPSHAASRAEDVERLRDALESMKDFDREILLLRDFEELTFEHCALVVGIPAATLRARHLRALQRLTEILARYGGATRFPPRGD